MGNFTPDALERLIQLIDERLDLITTKGNSASTNAKRDSAYAKISKILNTENRRSEPFCHLPSSKKRSGRISRRLQKGKMQIYLKTMK